MKRIIVSVTNDLVTDQRVHKVCNSLALTNFDVLLIGRKLPDSININRSYKTHRIKLIFNKGFLFYAEYNIRLFFKLLFLKKDILLANDLDTLLPNFLISKLFKKKIVYDSHELFTEVPELISRPFQQKIWLKIEQLILPKIKNCFTVSNPIANYYNSKYSTRFSVVRNFPYQINTKVVGSFPFKTNNKKMILYQGAINKGRGLELLINTMAFIENSIFVIIGDGDIKKEITQQINKLQLQEKVKLISKITPKELHKLTPLVDLGISIEEDLGLNYKYALPNKLFDYIQAKIPVLASDLPEMRKVIVNYGVGEIITDRNPKILAKQINVILQKGKIFYTKNLEKASDKLTWENESKKLIAIFNNLK